MRKTFWCCWVVLLCGMAVGQAQIIDEAINRPNLYQYTDRTEASISINVWNATGNSGVYMLRPNTPLIELLTLAGPNVGVENTIDTRAVTVKVSRKYEVASQVERQVVFEEPLDNIFVSADLAGFILQDEDIISIEVVVSEGLRLSDWLSILTTAATLALLLERIFGNNGG